MSDTAKKRLRLPNPAEVAADLAQLQNTIPAGGWVDSDDEPDTDDDSPTGDASDDTDDDDEPAGMDVRLQIHERGGWSLRSGDSSYDQDHRGYWGAGYLTTDTDCADLAAELIDEAGEHAAQCDREVIDYNPADDSSDDEPDDDDE